MRNSKILIWFDGIEFSNGTNNSSPSQLRVIEQPGGMSEVFAINV